MFEIIENVDGCTAPRHIDPENFVIEYPKECSCHKNSVRLCSPEDRKR